MMTKHHGGFLKGVFWGTLIGAALGILYAPDKGEKTRKTLKAKKDKIWEDSKIKLEEAKIKAEEARIVAEPIMQDIQTKVGSFIETVQEESGPLKEELAAIAEDVEKKVEEGIEEAKKVKRKYFRNLK